MIYIIKVALSILAELIEFLIIIRALLSFFPSLQGNKIAQLVYQMTEPILYPCRAILERIGLGNGMFDFSPLLAFLLIRVVLSFIYML